MHKLSYSPILDRMRPGHKARTGHELVAHMESEDGELWRVVRDCCASPNPAAHLVADMSMANVRQSLADMPEGAHGSDMHRALLDRQRQLQQPR